MMDMHGNPLPENECGHFTVHDPDRHELFFNTHPPERVPFEKASLQVPRHELGIPSDQTLLGRFICCLYVADLRASQFFYETLGLVVVGLQERTWVTSPVSHGNIRFAFQLQQSTQTGVVLRFHRNTYDGSTLKTIGFSEHGEGWHGEDPDGRTLELLPRSKLFVG